MIRTPQQILVCLARYGTLAIAAINVAVVLVLMCYRLPYPFEIDWMEGAMVDQVRRIVAGQPIYVAPSTEFVPFLYPPGFFYLSALLTQIVGEGFLGLRLVSALSSVGVLVLIALVWRETGVRHLGVVAAGLFAATYRIGGTYFDVGRVDMLFLFLLLGSFFAIRFGSRTRTYTVAGCCLSPPS
jgi:4-amino-4-deoxy-L-arabinose transferase-like glycosyltransferase